LAKNTHYTLVPLLFPGAPPQRMTIISILQIAIGMLTGAVVGIGIWASVMRHRAERAENQAAKLIADAKRKQQDILLQAKEKAIKELDQAEIDAKERRNEIKQMQQRLEQRENAFDKKLLSLEEKSSDIEKEKERLRGIKRAVALARRDGAVLNPVHLAGRVGADNVPVGKIVECGKPRSIKFRSCSLGPRSKNSCFRSDLLLS